MNPSTARWFALGTGLLALASVLVAAVICLRLVRSRDELTALKHDGRCPAAAAGKEAR